MAPKPKQAARRAKAQAKARESLSHQSQPGGRDDHVRWLAAHELPLQRKIAEMALRFAAAKGKKNRHGWAPGTAESAGVQLRHAFEHATNNRIMPFGAFSLGTAAAVGKTYIKKATAL